MFGLPDSFIISIMFVLILLCSKNELHHKVSDLLTERPSPVFAVNVIHVPRVKWKVGSINS